MFMTIMRQSLKIEANELYQKKDITVCLWQFLFLALDRTEAIASVV